LVPVRMTGCFNELPAWCITAVQVSLGLLIFCFTFFIFKFDVGQFFVSFINVLLFFPSLPSFPCITGTTAAGLRYGCPSWICPFFGDQHFWGEMVHRRKVGPKPCPIGALTLPIVAESLVRHCLGLFLHTVLYFLPMCLLSNQKSSFRFSLTPISISLIVSFLSFSIFFVLSSATMNIIRRYYLMTRPSHMLQPWPPRWPRRMASKEPARLFTSTCPWKI